MPCLCNHEKDNGESSDHLYKVLYGSDVMLLPRCEQQMEFSATYGKARLAGYAISVVIVIISTVVRGIFIKIASIVKFKSNSQRIHFVIMSLFSVLFAYYGILYLITPLRLEIPLISYFTIGVYRDFNQYWFGDVGYQIASVLLIKAFFLPTEFITKYSLWFFLRSLD